MADPTEEEKHAFSTSQVLGREFDAGETATSLGILNELYEGVNFAVTMPG